MTSIPFSAVTRNDAELVRQSIAGDRDAFGQIVARYQSLVCGVAYSATGSRSHSEDVAQETFVTAWRKLRELREPNRLCAWLCGIARNVVQGDLRRLERQPAHRADVLDEAGQVASAEPLPTGEAVSNEEMAILWREVGRLPETYREPLILYYRDHKSAEHVAAALELTPDAVMQRLTRGRRLLQERMLEFVESTLLRTNPGPQFTHQVQAALPLVAVAGPIATTTAAAKGGAVAKSGLLGFLLVWVAPFVGLFAAMGMSWAEISQAKTKRERRFAARWNLALWLAVAALVGGLFFVDPFVRSLGLEPRQDWTATAPRVALWFGFAMISVTLVVLMLRRKAALRRELIAAGAIRESSHVPASSLQRVAPTIGFLTALFWMPLFLAWQTGDRAVAWSIAIGIGLVGGLPLVLTSRQLHPNDEAKWGGRIVAVCGLVFLGILNARLDVWLASICRVDLEQMHRLLPPVMLHGLSVVIVAWVVLLLFVTRPDDPPSPESA